MARSVRLVPGNPELTLTLIAYLNSWANAVLGYATIANGTTAGKLKTTSTVSFKVDGRVYTKSATDDLWDLSAETDTTGSQHRAYWLYINASGTASIEAGSNAASGALALAGLPVPSTSKSVFGVFLAGPSTNFDAGGGLTGQSGAIVYHGIPPESSYIPGTKSGTYGISGLLTVGNA